MSSNNEQTMIEYPIDTFYNIALNDEFFIIKPIYVCLK